MLKAGTGGTTVSNAGRAGSEQAKGRRRTDLLLKCRRGKERQREDARLGEEKRESIRRRDGWMQDVRRAGQAKQEAQGQRRA